MDKKSWISKRVSELKGQGKTAEESLAIAIVGWNNRHNMQQGGTAMKRDFSDMFLPQGFPTYQPNFTPLTNPYQQSGLNQVNPIFQANSLPPQFNQAVSQGAPTQIQGEDNSLSQIAQDIEDQQLEDSTQQAINLNKWAKGLPQDKQTDVISEQYNQYLNQTDHSTYQGQNNNQIYNPQIINPYGGISLEQSLSYAGQGFGEGDGQKAALGTGLSFLKGARTFSSGLGFGAQNRRVQEEARNKLYNTEPNYNMQEGGTTYSQVTPEQLAEFNRIQAQNDGVIFNQEGADRIFGTEGMRPYTAPTSLDLGKYKGLNYFNVDQQGGEFRVTPTKRNPHNPDTYESLIKYLQTQNPQAKFARQNYVPMENRSMQQGGEITNAEYLTGQFITDEGQGANVEIEAGEQTRNSETGQIQEAVGDKHSEGGIDVNLPDGSQVLSDYTQIGKENAKKFRDEFGINVKASDTFAEVMDKVNKKLGLDKIIKEEAENTEELEKQLKAEEQGKTNELNVEYLQKELERAQLEKHNLKPEQDRAFEIIFEEQEKIPKKDTPEMKYGGEIKALAKKYGVDLKKVDALMKEGGVKMKQGGEYRGLEELKETARRLGYEGNYDFSLQGETQNEDLRKMQAFIAEKDPQMVIDYFTKSGQAITADGIDIIKKTSPETFEKAGIKIPKNSADLSEEDRKKLQQTYVEEGKATPEFWTTQFVDGRYAYRAPQKAAQTDFTINPENKADINAPLPTRMANTTPQDVAVQAEEQAIIEQQKQQKGTTGQFANAMMPVDFLLPPNAMQSVFKAQADLGRLDPTKISPEANLAEIEAQRQQAAEQISYLPEAQQAAAFASLLGTTQSSANQAISQTELANQAEQARVQQYNTQVGDKENLLNQQFNQDYEQKVFAAQNNTDRDLRQYFSDLNDQNRYNFNYIDRRNLFNQAPYNYKYDGQGLSFNNESILPQTQDNGFGAEYNAWIKTLSPQEYAAEQKRLAEQYKNS